MAFGRRPSTDFGTAALHAVLFGAFVVLLASGLRIASDDPDAMGLSLLDPILPMEHLWYRHLVAGVVLTAGLAGYAVYVVSARLGARLRFDRARLATIWRGGKSRYSALNVAVVWILLGSLIFEIGSGTLIFWGAGQGVLILHRWVAWLCIVCVVAHVALHGAYGGVQQVLRIFNPSRLRIGEPPPDLAELLADQLRRRSVSSSASAASPANGFSDTSGSLQSHPLATALVVGLLTVGVALRF